MHSKLKFLVTQGISLAIFSLPFFRTSQGNFVTVSRNQIPQAATEKMCSARTAVTPTLPAVQNLTPERERTMLARDTCHLHTVLVGGLKSQGMDIILSLPTFILKIFNTIRLTHLSFKSSAKEKQSRPIFASLRICLQGIIYSETGH